MFAFPERFPERFLEMFGTELMLASAIPPFVVLVLRWVHCGVVGCENGDFQHIAKHLDNSPLWVLASWLSCFAVFVVSLVLLKSPCFLFLCFFFVYFSCLLIVKLPATGKGSLSASSSESWRS